jgi:hypothetical protein
MALSRGLPVQRAARPPDFKPAGSIPTALSDGRFGCRACENAVA